MDKKELKFYEAPACEVVELGVSSALLAESTQGTNAENTEIEGGEEGGDL